LSLGFATFSVNYRVPFWFLWLFRGFIIFNVDYRAPLYFVVLNFVFLCGCDLFLLRGRLVLLLCRLLGLGWRRLVLLGLLLLCRLLWFFKFFRRVVLYGLVRYVISLRFVLLNLRGGNFFLGCVLIERFSGGGCLHDLLISLLCNFFALLHFCGGVGVFLRLLENVCRRRPFDQRVWCVWSPLGLDVFLFLKSSTCCLNLLYDLVREVCEAEGIDLAVAHPQRLDLV